MSELVERLSDGNAHPVIASRAESASELMAQIERGFVLIKFTETKGGTELGIRLNLEESELSEADFEASTGRVRLVGDLVLDYVPVRLTGDLDISDLKGTGSLSKTDLTS